MQALHLTLPLLVCSLLSAQATRPSAKPSLQQDTKPATLTLDGKACASPVAVLDPAGTLELRAEGLPAPLHLRFSPFVFPKSGEHALGGENPLSVGYAAGEAKWTELTGAKLNLSAFGPKRTSGTLSYAADDTEHVCAFDIGPALRPLVPARVIPAKRVAHIEKPLDKADIEDLVFCAFGGHGTGLPGQKLVANSIAKLAETGPLDFVLPLGDHFMPGGVSSTSDLLWSSRFEEAYDSELLSVPFYPVLSENDLSGSARSLFVYSAMNRRWSLDIGTYSFTRVSHGKTFQFFGIDTTDLLRTVRDARMRVANRMFVQPLEKSTADWKIVYGSLPFFSNGSDTDVKKAEKLRTRMSNWLKRFGVDLYIAGADKSMQLLQPVDGTYHIVSGGGGGAEVARSVRWEKETIFAQTGGGFTWFRFNGKGLEVSFRDQNGKVLYTHWIYKKSK